jgi:hypothetical protein
MPVNPARKESRVAEKPLAVTLNTASNPSCTMDLFPSPDGARPSQAMSHPIRAELLRLLVENESLSPTEALELLDGEGIALSNVAYHARVLHDSDLVEVAGDCDRGRGIPYRATPAGIRAIARS